MPTAPKVYKPLGDGVPVLVQEAGSTVQLLPASGCVLPQIIKNWFDGPGVTKVVCAGKDVIDGESPWIAITQTRARNSVTLLPVAGLWLIVGRVAG